MDGTHVERLFHTLWRLFCNAGELIKFLRASVLHDRGQVLSSNQDIGLIYGRAHRTIARTYSPISPSGVSRNFACVRLVLVPWDGEMCGLDLCPPPLGRAILVLPFGRRVMPPSRFLLLPRCAHGSLRRGRRAVPCSDCRIWLQHLQGSLLA